MRQEFLRLYGVECVQDCPHRARAGPTRRPVTPHFCCVARRWRKKLSPLFVRMRQFNPERLQDMLSFDPFGEKQGAPAAFERAHAPLPHCPRSGACCSNPDSQPTHPDD